MSIDRETPTEHERVDLLLPWYLNETLEADELTAVEAHLTSCESCQRQLKTLRSVRSAVQLSNEEVARRATENIHSLLERIDTEKRSPTSVAESWWRATWTRVHELLLAPQSPGRRLVPVLAVLVIVVQSGAIVGLLARGRSVSLPRFKTASMQERANTKQEPATSLRPRGLEEEAIEPTERGVVQLSASARSPLIGITFQDGVSERTVRNTILSVSGTIVYGPTIQGEYLVSIRLTGQLQGKARAKPSEETLQAVLERLRAQTDIVKLARLSLSAPKLGRWETIPAIPVD